MRLNADDRKTKHNLPPRVCSKLRNYLHHDITSCDCYGDCFRVVCTYTVGELRSAGNRQKHLREASERRGGCSAFTQAKQNNDVKRSECRVCLIMITEVKAHHNVQVVERKSRKRWDNMAASSMLADSQWHLQYSTVSTWVRDNVTLLWLVFLHFL